MLIQTGGHFGGPEVYVVTWVGEGRIALTQAQGRRLRNIDKCLMGLRLFLDPHTHLRPSVCPGLPSIAVVLLVLPETVRSLAGGLLGRAQAQDRGLRNMDKRLQAPRLFLYPDVHLRPSVCPVLPSNATVLLVLPDTVRSLVGGLLGARTEDQRFCINMRKNETFCSHMC